MARFSEQFVQQVQQVTDIVDLVSQYVALKRRGKEFVGLCPFHDDKKPSMYVSPAKQIFKCFACGSGGDVFKFLTLYEKYTFPEAVKTLAERANIPLPNDDSFASASQPQNGMGKRDLMEVTRFAAEFFQRQLQTAAGASALKYARDRGFSDESINRFTIGYAPDAWETLLRAAMARGISENQLLAAGLIIRRDNSGGCYDRFRNRLIFPIFDVSGNVIAFGGRALAADDNAKYLNSPETALFDKSGSLFAMNLARETIVKTGTAVVVEGYLDALIPHQAGVSNIVATLGTALTDRHVRLLARYAKEAVLIFDADQAGAKAAERALEIFLAQQLHVRVATISEGKDPCDFCLSEGATGLQTLIDTAPDALAYVWQHKYAEYKQAGENLADRRRVVNDFLTLIASSSAYGAIDDLKLGQLAQHIAHMVNIPASELQQQMRKLSRTVRYQTPKNAPAPSKTQADATSRNPQRIILEVLLNEPDMFHVVADQLSPEDFITPQSRAIAERIWHLGEEGKLNFENVQACAEMEAYSHLLAELVLSGERREHYAQSLARAVEHLLYIKNQQELHSARAGNLDDHTLRKLSDHLKTPDPRRVPKIM